ncbi:MAG: tRNA pseudouridine(38-40) synthase TruA [Crocinitomicaceae bacterium]|nr:MAG: tRNA pseudouridine(38-40) synthase TruA [Crocinitomicaceae bacterium]
MERYIFRLSYNGKIFFGWQRQPNQLSVQEVIEDALFKLNHNKLIQVVGCGRTDTGVHAKDYVLHVDLNPNFYNTDLLFKLNRILPDSVSIESITLAPADFHARFSAKSRTYRYFIHQQKDPFATDFSLYFPTRLNFEAMNEAATHLVGNKDFTSLSKLHTDVKTNICDVSVARWVQTDKNSAYFEITADRFLRNMVRATVGTLLEVGTGKIQPIDVISILEEKDRQAAKMSAPGHALFLWEILY